MAIAMAAGPWSVFVKKHCTWVSPRYQRRCAWDVPTLALATQGSCRYHQDAWHHHCARVECYHFANRLQTQLCLGQDLKFVHVESRLRFLAKGEGVGGERSDHRLCDDRQRAEFVDNAVVRFQSQLPGGLDLGHGEWEVGLTSLLRGGISQTCNCCTIIRCLLFWVSLSPASGRGPYNRQRDNYRLGVEPVMTRTQGEAYVKAITEAVEQQFLHAFPADHTFIRNVMQGSDTVEKKKSGHHFLMGRGRFGPGQCHHLIERI